MTEVSSGTSHAKLAQEQRSCDWLQATAEAVTLLKKNEMTEVSSGTSHAKDDQEDDWIHPTAEAVVLLVRS